MTIQVTRSSMPTLEDYIEEIKPIFESRQLTNMGPVYKKFQHALIDYLKVQYLSLFTNGHLALETAIQALGLKRKRWRSYYYTFYFCFNNTCNCQKWIDSSFL